MPKGEHQVQVEFVDVLTRQAYLVANAKGVTESSCMITPIHGQLIAEIQKPGLYFVNVSVDGRLVGSGIFAAETDKPQFSYTLLDQDAARVTAGELVILAKNSHQGPRASH
jgi:hypothetical protein